MKTINIFLLIACYFTGLQITNAQSRWITSTDEKVNEPNTWIAYRKDVSVEKVPAAVIARIAVDSKYWLWINGEMVIFEGGLKRGPNPRDTYYDELDIAPFLK
ncbi:MAG: glycoside hydrolase, partial [Dysgonamonadaceae bacterium]|nr:glycoside hydrolase [Dysgonamonadaceae bacterium]